MYPQNSATILITLSSRSKKCTNNTKTFSFLLPLLHMNVKDDLRFETVSYETLLGE